ncbi:hypothetical protein JCM3765_005526 [Sporobolomyces pararoseus]
MPRRSHIAVKLARNLTPQDLATKLGSSYGGLSSKAASLEVPLRDKSALMEIYNVKSLPREVKDWIWELFESNMKSLYQQSEDGWDPADKRKELFHVESRFCVLRSNDLSIESDGQKNRLLGYTIFRFDTEETAGDEEADVVYCYELQVESNAHGQGVGRLLMDRLERIGKATKMDKTMLTVFKANGSATSFYEKIGFVVDEIDPSNYEESDEVDYKILSKPC